MGLLDSIILLFAIVDAPGNLPIFIDLTAGMDAATRQKVYNVATLAGLAVLIIFALAGRFVLNSVFQISVAEFQIAGGVLLVAIGVRSMVVDERASPEVRQGIDIAAVPMACPLLVGPGAIVTAMLIVERSGLVHALIASAIVFALVRVIFWLAEPIRRLLGHLVLMILSRIMRIFIVAIGIHYIVLGLQIVFRPGA